MIERLYLGKRFGVGPIGLFLTILIWFLAYSLERLINIPQMSISPIIRVVLLAIFLIDGVYLIFGSLYYLFKFGHEKTLIMQGPYQFIRHPIYGAEIYSFTGIVAILAKSWFIISSVVPLTLMWSWLVQVEENRMIAKFGKRYLEYMENTGQFLPSWRKMKENIGENNPS